MVFVLDAVEVVFGHDSERTGIATKYTAEQLYSQMILLALRDKSCLRTLHSSRGSIGQNDVKFLDVIKAKAKRVKNMAEPSCLSMASNVYERAFSMWNRDLELLQIC